MRGHGTVLLLVLVLVGTCGTSLRDNVGDDDHELDEVLNKAADAAKQDVEINDQTNNDNNGKGPDMSADGMLTLFDQPDNDVATLARAASIQLKTLKQLNSLQGVETNRLRVNPNFLRVWKNKFGRHCPMKYKNVTCDPAVFYRSADGSCNNLYNPTWGATFSPELREIPPMYDDGVDAPRARDRLSYPLPSARLISNVVHQTPGDGPRNPDRTVMVMQWGQFIDHEFVATPVMTGTNGTSIKCCGEANTNRSECFPIEIPANDTYFSKTCMNFVRSAPVSNLHCDPGFREQMNQVTSFIDGSAVYGSKPEETLSLRTMVKGLLKTSEVRADMDMLPRNSDDKCTLHEPKDYCQYAGDFRVNVVPSLGLMHTSFLREHNRIAQRLAELNPSWGDETLFQETRRIVAAMEQVITYKEYLPAIMNNDSIRQHKLGLKTSGYYNGYRKSINPAISNVFAAAAFRFGHSQILDYQAMMSRQYTYVSRTPIEHTYHNPHMMVQDEGRQAGGIARWLVDDPTPLADGLFGEGVRNKLFQDSDMNSLDLAALNIQRGRDHGLPSYNHWRVHCNLKKATMSKNGSFLMPDHSADQTSKLKEVYRHVDDIDLYTGAMTETLLPGSSLGPTFMCLIGRQFRRLKVGDRFWHETNNRRVKFTTAQLQEIRKISLARIMCNCYTFDVIQPDVFRVPGPKNVRIPCDELPDIDLSKWKAARRRRRDGRPYYRVN